MHALIASLPAPIKSFLKRFPPAIEGLRYALRHDKSVRGQFFGGALVIFLTLFISLFLSQQPTLVEVILLLLGWILILITELQNSAIEVALDHLHPERHPEIKKSKDTAAGAVLLSGIFFSFIVAVVLLT